MADEALPPYRCDVHIEGVFQRKLEMEKAIKRSEARHWSQVYAVLHGTALHIHKAKRCHSAGGSHQIDPDRPPNLAKGALVRSYSLAFAEVGIAADYVK